ncbi:MAG: tRNA (N6-isopentenyl adenosine(37)-C2)-methylthiotransferase MiaB [Pseudomonadota bacterium]|nr:tRNA (N6-isopentenyl adenosine(37)-C2)-methylthiotransferase MiaB [Pseudomonadota bacterium]
MQPPSSIAHHHRFFIKTYGCQMNSYDSEKMSDILKSKLKMVETNSIDDADLIIMNTCSIREKAQEKVFSELGRWKKSLGHRQAVIAVTGCVASQEAEQLIKRAPIVNLVLGPQTIHRLPLMYLAHLMHKTPQVDVSFPEIEKFDQLPQKTTESVTAFLSIMEGCNKYCTYCIVPYTRGTEISRSYNDVMNEAKHLVAKGIKEITLLGQNVNDYDGTIDQTGESANLALLIHAISHLSGIQRIRFTTSHPAAFDQTLIDAYSVATSKLCKHLHLPVQSGSNRILSLMKRDYTCEQYIDIIQALKQCCPGITISTDIIVGFPGETDDDFEQTLKLVDTIGYDHSYSFIYSPRPGTPASSLKDLIPLNVKKERLALLQTKLKESAQYIAQDMLNRSQPVLVESVSQHLPGHLMGRTENNRVVQFQGPEELVGNMTNVTITQILDNSLRGRLEHTTQPHAESIEI